MINKLGSSDRITNFFMRKNFALQYATIFLALKRINNHITKYLVWSSQRYIFSPLALFIVDIATIRKLKA